MSFPYFGIRIVSLPRELNTVAAIADFVETILRLGKPENIAILDERTPLGVTYKSALISISQWSENAASYSPHEDTLSVTIDRVPFLWHNGRQHEYLFHFHNETGLSTNYITFVFLCERIDFTPVENRTLAIGDAWNSIYIPMAFDKFLNTNYMKELFAKHLNVGDVERVDYVSRCDNGASYISAYVHFARWYDTPHARSMRLAIEEYGVYKCRGISSGDLRSAFDGGRFLSFKINRRPVPNTELPPANIHQVAAANESMAVKIAQLQDLTESMQQDIYGLHLELSMAGAERPFVHAGCKLLTEDESEMWAKCGVFDVDENGEATVKLVLPGSVAVAAEM